MTNEKVLIFTTLESVPWGGSEQLWCDVAGYLAEKGHKVMANTVSWPEQPAPLRNLGEKGVYLTTRFNPHTTHTVLNRVKNKAAGDKWKKEITAFNPDVILINAGGSFDNVLLQHGNWLLSLNKPVYLLCNYINDAEYMPDSRREFFRNFLGKLTTVFFVSNRNHVSAERILAARISNGYVINNPIKLKKDVSAYPPTDVYRMAVVARLEMPVKGHDLVAELFSQEQWKERNFHINIYGSGLHEKYVREMFSFYKLDDKVTFCGHTSDVTEIWNNNHLLLLVSRGEGKPLSLLEAGYCKRAALVTDVGGSAEVVTDGVNGFVADAPVIKCVTETMERAWAKRESWEQMGIAAKEFINNTYKTDPVADFADMLLKKQPVLQ